MDMDFSPKEMMNHDRMDGEMALGWHPAYGILVGEWMKQINNYATDRDRKCFFGVNDWGMPCVFFDCSNKRELAKLIGEKVMSETFLNPRKG